MIVMRPFGDGDLLRRRPSAGGARAAAPFGVETWPQALLKWALSDERDRRRHPRDDDPERARENAAAGEPPLFGQAERDYVAKLAAAAR